MMECHDEVFGALQSRLKVGLHCLDFTEYEDGWVRRLGRLPCAYFIIVQAGTIFSHAVLWASLTVLLTKVPEAGPQGVQLYK